MSDNFKNKSFKLGPLEFAVVWGRIYGRHAISFIAKEADEPHWPSIKWPTVGGDWLR